ncbi:hypothetical protein BH10BDE1_BH10BDE1_22640 [soil metagenome]
MNDAGGFESKKALSAKPQSLVSRFRCVSAAGPQVYPQDRNLTQSANVRGRAANILDVFLRRAFDADFVAVDFLLQRVAVDTK